MQYHIGIYSGTFDPIHQGHITFAIEAMKICKLNKVVLLPEPEPRQKQNVMDINQRINLINQAIADYKNLSVASPSSIQFTVNDTLPQLREITQNADLTLLVGSDVVHTFLYRWQDLKLLLSEVSLAIGVRAGDKSNDVIDIITGLEAEFDMKIEYKLIYTPDSHVTSSQIRNSSAN